MKKPEPNVAEIAIHIRNENEESQRINAIEDISDIENNSIERNTIRAQKRKKEKKNLENFIKINERELENLKIYDYDNLEQYFEQKKRTEEITKNIKSPYFSRCCFFCMFDLFLTFISIVYTIGIFECVSIMKIINKVFLNSLFLFWKSLRSEPNEINKFSIEDFNNNYNFYSMFYEDAKKDPFDFKLLIFTNFIGYILLKSIGFVLSSIICLIINLISIYIIMQFSFVDYDFDYNTYSFGQIIVLFIIWIILVIGVGSSSLLSLQIIINYRSLYNLLIEKLNEETEKKIEEKRKKWEKRQREKRRNSDFDDFEIINGSLFLNYEFVENETKEINGNPMIMNQINQENNLLNMRENIEDTPEIFRNAKTMTDRNSNNTYKKDKYKKQKNKEKKELIKDAIKYTFIIFIIVIAASFGKIFFNTLIIYLKEEKTPDYMNIAGCNNDIDCYKNIVNNKNLSISDTDIFEKLMIRIYEDERSYFKWSIIIYVGFILFGTILYSIFYCCNFSFKKNEENIEQTLQDACDIGGCLCKYETNCTFSCCKCLVTPLKIIFNYICFIINSIIRLIIELYKCDNELQNYEKCQVHSCWEDEIEPEKEERNHGSCIQSKSLPNWINEFLTGNVQARIIIYLLGYFFLQLTTLAFEKEYLDLQNKNEIYIYQNKLKKFNIENITALHYFSNGKKENENKMLKSGNNYISKIDIIYIFAIFAGVCYIFFYITFSFSLIRKLCSNKKENKKINDNQDRISKSSTEILEGILAILYFNSIYSLIFSVVNIYNIELEILKNLNCYIYLIPILMNKFYYCIMIYFCISYSQQNDKLKLIKGSALISLYLKLWYAIISSIKDNISLQKLYNIQFWISAIICFIFLIMIMTKIISICSLKCSRRLSYLLCVIRYISCFGIFCMNENSIDNMNNLFENSECTCDDFCCYSDDYSYCCFDFLNFFKCYDISRGCCFDCCESRDDEE